jgi:hypothetical protein
MQETFDLVIDLVCQPELVPQAAASLSSVPSITRSRGRVATVVILRGT